MVRSHDFARPHHRGSVLVLIDTWPESSYREIASRTVGSGMDPRSTGIPWPAGVCAIGALVVVCGLSAVGGALAAPEPSMLRPDAPPSGAVVSPIARPARSEAVQGAMGRRLRPPLPLPVSRSRLPKHPIPSLAPTQSPGLHPPRNALCCLPRPHAARRSQARSCSRGEGTYPTVSEPSWRPRSPASRIEGPTAGSRPSRAHFSRWWPSVQVA